MNTMNETNTMNEMDGWNEMDDWNLDYVDSKIQENPAEVVSTSLNLYSYNVKYFM